MSGNKELIIEKMDKVMKILDEYESRNGLPTPRKPGTEEELQEYLNMKRDKLEKLSIEDNGNIAYRLKQYALYIQRLYNRETSRLAWISTELNIEISKNIHKYDKMMKYINKVAIMAQKEEYISILYKIHSHARQRIQRLTFLSSHIKDMGDAMLSIQRIKINMLKGER